MKLLLIEDIASVRTALALILRLVFKDPTIDETATVKDAIDKLYISHYDAVISDYNLGIGGVGTQVEEFLKKNKRKEKFILCSSLPPRSYCGQMLSKPFSLQDIKNLKKSLEQVEGMK